MKSVQSEENFKISPKVTSTYKVNVSEPNSFLESFDWAKQNITFYTVIYILVGDLFSPSNAVVQTQCTVVSSLQMFHMFLTPLAELNHMGAEQHLDARCSSEIIMLLHLYFICKSGMDLHIKETRCDNMCSD